MIPVAESRGNRKMRGGAGQRLSSVSAQPGQGSMDLPFPVLYWTPYLWSAQCRPGVTLTLTLPAPAAFNASSTFSSLLSKNLFMNYFSKCQVLCIRVLSNNKTTGSRCRDMWFWITARSFLFLK